MVDGIEEAERKGKDVCECVCERGFRLMALFIFLGSSSGNPNQVAFRAIRHAGLAMLHGKKKKRPFDIGVFEEKRNSLYPGPVCRHLQHTPPVPLSPQMMQSFLSHISAADAFRPNHKDPNFFYLIFSYHLLPVNLLLSDRDNESIPHDSINTSPKSLSRSYFLFFTVATPFCFSNYNSARYSYILRAFVCRCTLFSFFTSNFPVWRITTGPRVHSLFRSCAGTT